MENVVKDESFAELYEKISQMQKIKASLKREIDQNQLESIDLRESIKALSDKKTQAQNELNKTESLIIKRREEISSIDTLLDKERKLIDAEKREIASQKEGLDGEMSVFRSEKQAALEAVEEQRKKLNRIEVSLLNQKTDLDSKERQITGELEEVSMRRNKALELEVKINQRNKESEEIKKEAEAILRRAEKELDDAKAKLVAYEAMSADIKTREKSFADKDAYIKTCYNDLEVRKSELDERERDITIKGGRIKANEERLRRELERAKIEQSRKDVILKDIGDERVK